jgi:hypothetical protein
VNEHCDQANPEQAEFPVFPGGTIVKVHVWLSDMKYFAEFNQEYSRHFSDGFPARSVVSSKLAFDFDRSAGNRCREVKLPSLRSFLAIYQSQFSIKETLWTFTLKLRWWNLTT